VASVVPTEAPPAAPSSDALTELYDFRARRNAKSQSIAATSVFCPKTSTVAVGSDRFYVDPGRVRHVAFAQRPAIRRRLGELVNSTLCGLCQWSGATPQLKRLGFDNGALSKPQRRGAGRLWRQVGVYSPAHLQRPAEPPVLHDRALIDARDRAERAVGQPMATVGRRQVC
jgi:hypothetical protein